MFKQTYPSYSLKKLVALELKFMMISSCIKMSAFWFILFKKAPAQAQEQYR